MAILFLAAGVVVKNHSSGKASREDKKEIIPLVVAFQFLRKNGETTRSHVHTFFKGETAKRQLKKGYLLAL